MEKIIKKWEIGWIILLFPLQSLLAQVNLSYQPCLNCPANTAQQNFKIKTTTDDVVSDFGRRDAYGASAWHRGTDLTVSGTEDYGYHLLSPVAGTVTQLFVGATGYKYIVIDGPGNQDFGFGHIFNDQSLPIKIGDLVLKQCNNLNSYAIINLTTNKAIGPANGAIVTYNNSNYLVSNKVVQGQVIAPLGTSGGVASHLHLYHPVNPALDPQLISNARDPMELCDHFSTSYTSFISNLSYLGHPGITTNYPGNLNACIIAGIEMLNPGALGSAPNQYYHTALMDIDKLELFIRKQGLAPEPFTQWGTAGSNYQLIQGPNYYSVISNGSRISSNPYPSDITGNYAGSLSHTGISPHAYNDAPYDGYFFSDIVTRIHKNHVIGQPLQLAGIEEDARYVDGYYDLFHRITRVSGQQYDVNASAINKIRIDNFRPFVKKVTAKKNAVVNPFYAAEWNWNGSTLQFNVLNNIGVMQGNDIIVSVTTTEPMNDIKLSIGTWSDIVNSPVDPANPAEWVIHVPAAALNQGSNTLRITGHDIAGNLVEGFINTQPKPAGSFPIRVSETQWNPYPYEYEDIVHNIHVLGNTPVQADFIPEVITVSPGDYVSFTDLSTGDNIIDWTWDFEEGNPPSSSTQNPVVQFNTYGDHVVSLTVHNTINYSSAIGIVTVAPDLYPPDADFTPKNVTVSLNTEVHFLDISTGNPDQWFWDFDGAAPSSTIQNPVVLFDHPGIYYVTLYVMNSAGIDYVMGAVHVVDDPFVLDVMCSVNPFLASPGVTVNLQGAVFNAVGPYLYTFDFGDGTLIPLASSSIQESVNHTYQNPGNYNLTVTVKDALNRLSSCYETVEIMGGNPCSGIQASFTVSPGEELFSVPVNTSVVFSDNSSGGTPPYLYHWTFSADPLTGAMPSSTVFNGAGPHTVTFPLTGNYPVTLHISDMNGCGSTFSRNITVFQAQHCLVAKINKMINGRLDVPLGISNFYDFTFVPWCGACQDPPGTSNYPCETNNYWMMLYHPLNLVLAQQYGNPFQLQGCALNSSLEQLFQYNFQQDGWYKLILRAWDQDCNVMSGFDCQDQTELLIHAIDCNKLLNICNNSVILNQGYNKEIFTGDVVMAGPSCPLIIPSGVDIDIFAVGEIKVLDGFEAQVGCELLLGSKPCPFSDATPSRPIATLSEKISAQDSWNVFPDPVNDLVNIEFSEKQAADSYLQISNLLGESLMKEKVNGRSIINLDLSSLQPGLYIITHYSSQKNRIKKIVKR